MSEEFKDGAKKAHRNKKKGGKAQKKVKKRDRDLDPEREAARARNPKGTSNSYVVVGVVTLFFVLLFFSHLSGLRCVIDSVQTPCHPTPKRRKTQKRSYANYRQNT
jgi:hypothetical protein